ncbi:MAG: ATP-binding cassette domain-containing protein [Pseudomonadota bacterium]
MAELQSPYTSAKRDVLIKVRDLTVGFGEKVIIEDLDLDVFRGEVLGIVGPSGTGKSVLLRAILDLVPRRSGTVAAFGADIDNEAEIDRRMVEQKWGVLFQHGALFSSLTVKENIQVPMREYLKLPQDLMDELAHFKLGLVGLPVAAGDLYPSELSGGMTKRAALARALALDPEIVFLDEPTSGLDPIGAAEFDRMIGGLRDVMGLTVFMVTHDLGSLHSVCDRIAVLGNRKVLVEGDIPHLLAFDDDWVQSYFRSGRSEAQAAKGTLQGALAPGGA